MMYNPKRLGIRSPRSLQRRPAVIVAVVVVVATLVVLGCRTGAAQDHLVYLPLVFKADTVILRARPSFDPGISAGRYFHNRLSGGG